MRSRWVWVADHKTDGSDHGVSVSAKGGVLVEATQGTWLSGLASEHFWLYNVAYHQASNVFNSLLQAETNYQQGNGAQAVAPKPWNPTESDPDFSWCDGSDANCPKTIAQYFSGNNSDIFVYASGAWNFDRYGGEQTFMNVFNEVPTNSAMFGLCAHDVTNVVRLPDGTSFGSAKDYPGSWGNLVAGFNSMATGGSNNTMATDGS